MSLPQPLLFATTNRHKVQEVQAILAPLGITVTGFPPDRPAPPEPEETGLTFEENAALKAMYYAAHFGRLCLADDSGLEVDALNGAPGVHSARYAGLSGPREVVDPANNRKLLAALEHVPDERRSARFVCALALCDGQHVLAQHRGEVAGLLLREPRGVNGFGYDPLFLIPALGRTTAELSVSEKNQLSHRGRAARALAGEIARVLGLPKSG